ncbi:MAG: DPP IV N-terminal domain-containing protein, partial [Thermomicrobiales bacterium]|nr:DPP IV N-terminal domain-containing protein [Thermomicrobiales bacterium]
MPRNQLDRSVYERASRLRPQVRDRYVHGRLLGVRWIAGGGGAICRVTTSTGGQIDVLFDSATRSLTELTSASENAYELIPSIQERSWSPSFAGTRLRSIDGDLYLDAAAGGSLRRLTHDGSSFNRYGACFVPHRADDPEVPAVGVWSRDGRYVLSQRLDYRGVRAIPYTEAAPSDGGAPILHTKIDAFPGDQHIVHAHPVVVDTQLGACRTVEMPSLPCTHSSPLLRGDCWWDELSASFFCLRSTRDWRTLQLWQIDPKTGAAQKLMEEASDRRLRPSQYFHQRPNVRVLHDQNGEVDRVVWFSERNGWGHLFLVDLNSGSWSRAITEGDWTVQEILRVNEQSGHIWLLASGLVASDPYRWTVLRVTIESGAVQRLTPDELDHRALVSRDDATNFFVDTASSANRPPVVRFLDWDGNELG